MGSVQ